MGSAMPEDRPKPFTRFDFDLAAAVLSQLVAAFDSLPIGPLTDELLSQVDPEQGVYQLYLSGKLMYVGKATDSLAKRLGEHLWNLKGRKNVNIVELGFKCVTIHRNWIPSTHEDMLIRHYGGSGLCEWNRTGLGNHDPGRNREDTAKKGFDLAYPINEEFVPAGIEAREWNARELLMAIKSALPYVFRYETDRSKEWQKGSDKYNTRVVTIPRVGMTARELLRVIVEAFPPTWQGTFFPSHVILYEENRTYTHSTLTLRV